MHRVNKEKNEMESDRKVIQFERSSALIGGHQETWCLCDDGTLWIRTFRKDSQEWEWAEQNLPPGCKQKEDSPSESGNSQPAC